MKIAVVTNNGDHVSQHFGRSRYFKIYTVEEGKITGNEMRERKTGHFGVHHHEHNHHHHHEGHGRGTSSEAMRGHDAMAEEISDCQVLIAGGMGMGAVNSFKAKGIEVILTDYQSIEEAVTAYAEGKIKNLIDERMH